MAFKQINLNGGINLQDSDLKKGFNEFADLQNLRHENGSLVKRHATGSSTTIGSADIDNMAIYVHRKLQGVTVALSGATKYSFATGAKTLTLSGTDPTSGVTIPGSTSKDWSTVFKSGDSIVINSQNNFNDILFTIDTITSTVITFLNAPAATETDIASGSNLELGFAWADYNDTSLKIINTSNANSYDGRAFLATHTNTNKFISLINPIDYTNKSDLLDFGTGSGDMHIRPTAYADAVRFSCGLEHSPRIFKYINRHFFNGMIKTVFNPFTPLLYPRWIIDTANPTHPTGTTLISNPDTNLFEALNGTASNSYVHGSLRTKDNNYRYKLVPVYDGNQEELLENTLFETSTISPEGIPDSKGVLGPDTACVKMSLKLNGQTLNPRMSSMNLYRSTNDGTYYKINSIYMGENDPNQELLEELHSSTDSIWIDGGGNDYDNTINKLCVDGYVYDFTGASLVANHNDAGYTNNTLETATDCLGELDAVVTNDSRMSSLYYGAQKTSIWNQKSEATETIFSNSGEAIGGSASGGWFIFNGATDLGAFDGLVNSNINDADGDAFTAITESNDTATSGPFDVAFADTNLGTYVNSGTHLKYNGGTSAQTGGVSMQKGQISSSLNTSQSYIVSGWICATGFTHTDSTWSLFVSQDGPNDEIDTGELLIAHGAGGDNQNIDKWRWFQYQFTPQSSTEYLFVRTTHKTGMFGTNGAKIRLKAFNIRPTVTNYTLDDGMEAFAGRNVLYGKKVSDIGAPNGALAGGRIQDVSVATTYPKTDAGTTTYVSNNHGPFLQTTGDVPGVNATLSETDYHFGTNHYQWYAFSDNLNPFFTLEMFDPGLPDGARHYNETATSTDVKFKYATMLNGRQFVANVKITSDEETEEYPNFVMFSEPNSPDVIPVSNFIQLQDLQGGEIVGIETLMSDIVVFMTNGIFRINIPSGDPTSWSLVESHPNIGCLNDKMITKAPNGIFLGTNEGIVYLDSGFSAKLISNPIKDTYQTQASLNPSLMRLHYESSNNRVRLFYTNASGGGNSLFYLYDISRGVWTNELHTSLVLDEMSIDDNNNTILIESASSTKVRLLENTSSNLDGGSVPISIIMRTGFEQISSFDQNGLLRRINTKVDAASTGADLAVFFNGSGSASYSNGNYLNGMQSTRAFTGNRGKTVQVKIEDNSNQDLTIEKIELEHE
tara:strand:- start:447 stop:3986 length:3540 start_codon:yes stop_codon:yes gene_type:complete